MAGGGHGEKRSRKWEAAIAALLEQPTIEKAAEKAGVAYSTLKGWVKLAEFQAAYRDTRRQVVEHALGRAQRSCGRAVRTLTRLLACGHPPTEKGAAVALLDYSLRGLEVGDLAQAVEDLKRELEGLRHGDGSAQAGGGQAEGPGGAACG
jgi:hypothetical protein